MSPPTFYKIYIRFKSRPRLELDVAHNALYEGGRTPLRGDEGEKGLEASTKIHSFGRKTLQDGEKPPYAIMHRGHEIALVFVEVHSGAYSSHIDGRSLAYKLLKIKYYWPTLMKDNVTSIEKYD